VYGAGTRSGINLTHKDCYYENQTGGLGISFHNNAGFTKPVNITLDNCRVATPDSVGMRFGTLNTNANGIINKVKLTGCKTKNISLIEENAALYGAGILWEVTGYSNDVNTATIINTDGNDYSSNIDLI
jgi:hypothetical protein